MRITKVVPERKVRRRPDYIGQPSSPFEYEPTGVIKISLELETIYPEDVALIERLKMMSVEVKVTPVVETVSCEVEAVKALSPAGGAT